MEKKNDYSIQIGTAEELLDKDGIEEFNEYNSDMPEIALDDTVILIDGTATVGNDPLDIHFMWYGEEDKAKVMLDRLTVCKDLYEVVLIAVANDFGCDVSYADPEMNLSRSFDADHPSRWV